MADFLSTALLMGAGKLDQDHFFEGLADYVRRVGMTVRCVLETASLDITPSDNKIVLLTYLTTLAG